MAILLMTQSTDPPIFLDVVEAGHLLREPILHETPVGLVSIIDDRLYDRDSLTIEGRIYIGKDFIDDVGIEP